MLKNTNTKDKIPYCIIVIPLLFETKTNYPIDRVLVVDCTEQQQIERTMQRDNISREQTQAIINSQISHSERLQKSDDIIKNTADTDYCYNQLNEIHKKYLSLAN